MTPEPDPAALATRAERATRERQLRELEHSGRNHLIRWLMSTNAISYEDASRALESVLREPLAPAEVLSGYLVRLAAVEAWLRCEASSTLLTLRVVEDIHSVVFEELYPEFAGRLRGPGPSYLPEERAFGPLGDALLRYAGAPYPDVPAECDTLFAHLAYRIRQLDDLQYVERGGAFAEDVCKLS